MPGDASVAQANREIASSEAFQNETCIGDRTVALDALQRIAERFRRDCNIVDQPDLPGLAVACQPEAKQWIFQCFGRKLQKPNLARNAEAHVFPIDLTDRPALLSSGSRTMPASRRRPAAKRAATPSASGCKARRLSSARRPDFAAFPIERLGLALRIGASPEHGTQEQINGSK